MNFFFYIDFINKGLENYFFILFLIYLCSLTIFFSFSLPGGPILFIISGFFFGFFIGFVINILSILIGSYLFISFSKIILRKFFYKFYFKYLTKLTNMIKVSSFEYLILFRLLQGNPLFIQNLCFSFVKISKFKFIISSFIGFSPSIIAFTYFGSKLLNIYEIQNIRYGDIISKEFIIFIIICILFLICSIFYKIKKNSLKNN